jgi:hypothetical protein
MITELFQVHPNARPATKRFEQKCRHVLASFISEKVPGDGYCLCSSISILVGTRVNHLLPAFVRKYQPELGGLIDLTNELDNPNNLSETWISFFADEFQCCFSVLTWQDKTDSYGFMTVPGFHTQNTKLPMKYLLLHSGHYYPLIPIEDIDHIEIATQWRS